MYLNKAIELTPYDDEDLYNLRGLVFEELGKEEESKSDISMHYWLKGRRNENEDEIDSAIENYTKSIEILPENKYALTSLSLVKNNHLNDYQGAIDGYTKAIKIAPKDALIYTNRAEAKRMIQEYKDALLDCEKAIEIDSNYYTFKLYSHH